MIYLLLILRHVYKQPFLMLLDIDYLKYNPYVYLLLKNLWEMSETYSFINCSLTNTLKCLDTKETYLRNASSMSVRAAVCVLLPQIMALNSNADLILSRYVRIALTADPRISDFNRPAFCFLPFLPQLCH